MSSTFDELSQESLLSQEYSSESFDLSPKPYARKRTSSPSALLRAAFFLLILFGGLSALLLSRNSLDTRQRAANTQCVSDDQCGSSESCVIPEGQPVGTCVSKVLGLVTQGSLPKFAPQSKKYCTTSSSTPNQADCDPGYICKKFDNISGRGTCELAPPTVPALTPPRTCIAEGSSGPVGLKCCNSENFENVDNSGQNRTCTKAVAGVCTPDGKSPTQQTNLSGANRVPCCSPLVEKDGICRPDPMSAVNCIQEGTSGAATLNCCKSTSLPSVSANGSVKTCNAPPQCAPVNTDPWAVGFPCCSGTVEGIKTGADGNMLRRCWNPSDNPRLYCAAVGEVPTDTKYCCTNLVKGSSGKCEVFKTPTTINCTPLNQNPRLSGLSCCVGTVEQILQLPSGPSARCVSAGSIIVQPGTRCLTTSDCGSGSQCLDPAGGTNKVCWPNAAAPCTGNGGRYADTRKACCSGLMLNAAGICSSASSVQPVTTPSQPVTAPTQPVVPPAQPVAPPSSGLLQYGARCTTGSQCASQYCHPLTRTCAYSPTTTPTATPFVPSGSRAIGADCTNGAQCLSQYCHPLAKVCAYSPNTTPTPTPFVPRGNKDNGEDCTNGAQCKSGFCSAARICADRPRTVTPPVSAPVCNNRDCQAGFSCQGGVCRQDGNLGQMCADGIRCSKDEYCTNRSTGTCVNKNAVPMQESSVTGQAPAPACVACTNDNQCDGNSSCQNGCCQTMGGGRQASCQRQCGPKCPGNSVSCEGSSWYFDAYSDDGRNKGSNCGAGPDVTTRRACILAAEDACCYGEVGDQSHCITVNKFTQKNAVNTKNNGKLAFGYDVTADFTKDFVRWQWPGQQGNIIAFIKGEFGQVDGGAKFALTRTTSTGLKDSQDAAKYFSGVIKNLTPGKHVIQMGWNPDSATGQPHTVMCKPSTVEMVYPANCNISFTAGGKRQEANPFLTYNVALGQPIKFEAGMVAPLTPDQAEQVDIFISKTTTVNGWLPAPNRATSMSSSTQLSWTPTEPGTYYVVCNGRTKDGFACTGNPWCEGNKCSPFMDCSKSSDKIMLRVTGASGNVGVVYPTPVMTPTPGTGYTNQPVSPSGPPTTVSVTQPLSCELTVKQGTTTYTVSPTKTIVLKKNAPILLQAVGKSTPVGNSASTQIYISKESVVNGWLPAPNRVSTAGTNASLSWTPTETGAYYVVCNHVAKSGAACSGNPWCEGGKCAGFSDCGFSDRIKLSITN